MRYVAATGVIFILFIFLTTASAQTPADSDRPSFSVGVYDYAGIPTPLLARAERETGVLFGDLGIQVTWATCSDSGLSPCAQLLGDRFIQVNVLNRSMFRKIGLSERCLAVTVGRTIYLFYQPLQDTLGNDDPEMPQILTNIIAHELGHVLLPSTGHSDTGIMRAIWSVRDLQNDAEFMPVQQRQLRQGKE